MDVREATKDISVQCIFNNAGFIVTGFFDSSPEEKQMGNLECNATAAAKVCSFSLFSLACQLISLHSFACLLSCNGGRNCT